MIEQIAHLCQAVEADDWQAFRKIYAPLREQGLNIENVIMNELPVLFYALANEKYRVFTELLFSGANPSVRLEGVPILNYAAHKDDIWAVDALISVGAKINGAAQGDGVTPLFVCESPEMCRHLIQKGADINHQNEAGVTPLMYQASCGHINVVQSLLEQKADWTMLDKLGKNVFIHAIQGGHLSMVQWLHEHGFQPVYASDGSGPLLLACTTENEQMVRLVLDLELDTVEPDDYNVTPLMVAASFAKPDLLQTLKDLGSNINEQNVDGLTALMWAVEAQNVPAVRWLLENGANRMLTDCNGKTAMDMNESFEIKNLFESIPLKVGSQNPLPRQNNQHQKGE